MCAGHGTKLPEFPGCYLVAVNHLVEPKRIDLTSVIPRKAGTDMFEKIGELRLMVCHEKRPVGAALGLLVHWLSCHSPDAAVGSDGDALWFPLQAFLSRAGTAGRPTFRECADLLEHVEIVTDSPVLGYLAVGHPINSHTLP